MKISLLKFVYRGLLTGMPILTYNPITKNNFIAPVTINQYSTYLNYKLDEDQTSILTKYIQNFNKDLEIVPIKLYKNELKKSFYLSVNVYNCTSPIMGNKLEIGRCEINTYIYDKKNDQYATLILDYISNQISMDPVNIFKESEDMIFYLNNNTLFSKCISKKDTILLDYNFNINDEKKIELSDDLVSYTDKIYYKNGLYDKLYYDSSLTNSELIVPSNYEITFQYRDLLLNNIDSIFYFNNPISFAGSMWHNLYEF